MPGGPGNLCCVATPPQIGRDPTEVPESESPSTYEYIHSLRIGAGLSIESVAQRAGVNPQWLERFESGFEVDGVGYETLLRLVRAAQPPRPAWWDDGHEHDLHLPDWAIPHKDRHPEYWGKIERVRAANREASHR